MLGITGGRRPIDTWRVPSGFPDRWGGVAKAVMQRGVELAGGNALVVTREQFLQALREALPDITAEEDDYARRVSLAVIQQVRGSNVHFADLAYLDAALRQGRVHPAEVDVACPTLSRSTFAAWTQAGTKTIDILKTTGVNWRVPRGFLSRYIPANQHVLRAAAAAAGARHGSTMDVVEGVWGRVTPAMFVAACQQVLGELSPEEEEYVAALAQEQVPAGMGYIRDVPYLDKCIQTGRTPTSIKGPTLLPTVFLNNTTAGLGHGRGGMDERSASLLLLRHTGGRAY